MAKDPREYGYEGEMAMSQLKGVIMHAKQLHDMLEPATDLPEWVQSKITLAYDYIQTAADYMSTEMTEEADSPYAAQYKAQRDATHRARVAAAAKQRNAKMNKNVKEEAPANVTAGVAKFDPILGPKKKMMKRFKEFKKG